MTQNFPYAVIFFDLGDTLITDGKSSDPAVRKKWIVGATATLDYLAAKAIPIGIISNTGDMTRDDLAKRLPQNFRFDRFHPDLIILSSEVKAENVAPKPSLEIFELARNRAQAVRQGDYLYCSENLEETLAAQQIGMHSLRLLMPPPKAAAGEVGALENTLQSLAMLKHQMQ